LGKDEWVNVKLTGSEYQWLEDAGAGLLNEAKLRWPQLARHFDNFSMETALCAYKKLHRVSRGRYVGYYLDRQSEEVVKAEGDGWVGIEWDVIWQARVEIVGAIQPHQNDDRADNVPGVISRLDSSVIVGLTDLELYDGFVVAKSEKTSAGELIRERVVAAPPVSKVAGYYWQHISYVAIWWLMAAIVLYLPFYRRSIKP
jgi:hypothetical protein